LLRTPWSRKSARVNVQERFVAAVFPQGFCNLHAPSWSAVMLWREASLRLPLPAVQRTQLHAPSSVPASLSSWVGRAASCTAAAAAPTVFGVSWMVCVRWAADTLPCALTLGRAPVNCCCTNACLARCGARLRELCFLLEGSPSLAHFKAQHACSSPSADDINKPTSTPGSTRQAQATHTPHSASTRTAR